MVQKRSNILKFGALFTVFFAFVPSAFAATLSFSPATVNVSAGNIVSVNLNVNAAGAPINTAAATIQFPTDLLQVMSVSKSNSIFSLWVQDPAFSNTAGTIDFTGGLPNPGYSGSNGRVMSVVFMAKKSGTASLVLSDPSVLANDGQGTDVLTAFNTATIKIGGAAPATPANPANAPAISPTPQSGSSPLPVIASATDPQQNVWYSDTSASFSWVVPSGVTSIESSLSKSSDSVPNMTYDSSVSERTVNNISDGTYYFLLRYMTGGAWGQVAAYKINVDSTPPQNFTLNVQTQGSTNTVALDAVDTMSGVDHYAIKIDGEDPVIVPENELTNGSAVGTNGQYVLPPQNAGSHSLAVIAYDKAGNHTESDTTYTAPAVTAPTIALSAQTVGHGSTVTVTGTTAYPDAPIKVFIQHEGSIHIDTYTATTSLDGSYSLVPNPLNSAGPTDVWSQLVFSDGVTSPLSNKVTVQVSESAIISTSKSVGYDILFIMMVILLIAALVFGVHYLWYKFFSMRKRLEKEGKEAIRDVRKSLELFKSELENQLKKLEKIKEDRDLNKKEEKIFKDLSDNIDDIEELIEKKIKKIL